MIERAAILAEGLASTAIGEWIVAHGGEPEALAPTAAPSGLHGGRLHGGAETSGRPPLRYVLPANALL